VDKYLFFNRYVVGTRIYYILFWVREFFPSLLFFLFLLDICLSNNFLLVLLIINCNTNLRSSIQVEPIDNSIITLNQEYLASLEKYQNLLTEKQVEIEKLEVLKINLEAKLQLLLEKSQHSFLFEFVLSNFNSILSFVVFILVWVLLNKLINHDLTVFLDGNLKSNELIQKNLIDSVSKLLQLSTETLQKAGDDNTGSLLDNLAISFFENTNFNNQFLVDQLSILMRSLSDSDSQSLVDIINEVQIVAMKIAQIDSQLSLLYPLLDTLVSQLVSRGLLEPLTSQMLNPSAFG